MMGAMTTILVTGATGTIGSKLVAALAVRDHVSVRAGMRDPARHGAPRVTPVECDFERPDTFAGALRGADKLFLLAPGIRDQIGASARLIEAAAAAGVRHVVKLSAMRCDDEPSIAFGRAHREVERLLARTAMAWTFLRPNNFMDNFLGVRHDAFAPDRDGTIALPWGDAACSFVASADIAAVAARVLTEDGHTGRVYELTGPEALSITQVAAGITQASGRAIRYIDTPEPAVHARLLAARMPPPVADAVLELHALGKAGRAARVTHHVAALTGRLATTFAAFAREHAASWRVS
jgi:uncharacterized protein YbjT (DUF2867 family)